MRRQVVVGEGVADQDVNAAQLGAGESCGPLPGILVGYVTLYAEGGYAGGAQPGGDGAYFVGHVEEDQAGALGGEPLGRGVPDAGGGTCDKRGLAGEPAVTTRQRSRPDGAKREGATGAPGWRAR